MKLLRQLPNTGERVERGDSVDVVISKGPEKVKMPNVIGLPEEALQKLKSLGLKDVTIEKYIIIKRQKNTLQNQSNRKY